MEGCDVLFPTTIFLSTPRTWGTIYDSFEGYPQTCSYTAARLAGWSDGAPAEELQIAP